MYYNLKDILQTLLKNKNLKSYKNEISDFLTPQSLLLEKKPTLFYIHRQNYDIFIDEATCDKILDTVCSSYKVLLKKDSLSSLFDKDEYFKSFEVSRYKDYLIEHEKLMIDLNNKTLQKNQKIENKIIQQNKVDKKAKVLRLFPKYKKDDKIVVLQFETKRQNVLKVYSVGLTIIENGKTESYFYKVTHKHSDLFKKNYTEHPYIDGDGYFIDADAIIATIRNHLKNASYLMSYALNETLDVFSHYDYDVKQNNNLQLFDLNDIQRPNIYIQKNRNSLLTLLHHFKVEYGDVANMGNKAIYLAEVVKRLNEST